MNLDGIYGNGLFFVLLLLAQKLKNGNSTHREKAKERKKNQFQNDAFFSIGFVISFDESMQWTCEICGLVSEMIQAVVSDGDFSFNDRKREQQKDKTREREREKRGAEIDSQVRVRARERKK